MAYRDAIAQVKATVRLEEICRNRGVELRACHGSAGERLEGCCPFHDDRSPSFSVYLHTQRYCCFGCGVKGDVIDFVQAYDRCSFSEALRRLLPTGTSVVVKHGSTQLRQKPPRTAQKAAAVASPVKEDWMDHRAILTQALTIYHQTLLCTSPVQAYLATRGVSLATIQRCRLGYADGASFLLSLRDNEQGKEQAQKAGLLTRYQKEWLAGRVIIPDLRDESCTWMIGRMLPQPLHRVCKPNDKYIGLAVPKTLLGYQTALAEWHDPQRRPLHGILIVEGAIDYVLAKEWRLPVLCVALLGTHASRQQLQALVHLHEVSGLPFLISLDADLPGRDATLHLLTQLAGLPARLFPELTISKDVADLGTRSDGYARLTQAWHAIGDGGEV